MAAQLPCGGARWAGCCWGAAAVVCGRRAGGAARGGRAAAAVAVGRAGPSGGGRVLPPRDDAAVGAAAGAPPRRRRRAPVGGRAEAVDERGVCGCGGTRAATGGEVDTRPRVARWTRGHRWGGAAGCPWVERGGGDTLSLSAVGLVPPVLRVSVAVLNGLLRDLAGQAHSGHADCTIPTDQNRRTGNNQGENKSPKARTNHPRRERTKQPRREQSRRRMREPTTKQVIRIKASAYAAYIPQYTEHSRKQGAGIECKSHQQNRPVRVATQK